MGSAVAARLGERAQLHPDLRVPRVSLTGRGELRPYLSRNTHRSLKKARNRLAVEGREVQVEFVADSVSIARLLVDVERVHRQRDHDSERDSDLDDPTGLVFWRQVILQHSLRGEVEVATLRIDGELAAYVVSLLDGSSYRVYDGRFDTSFAEYAPGRLLEAAALERALQDPRFTELDWWSGVASEKLLSENVSCTRQWLGASSQLATATPAGEMSDVPLPRTAPIDDVLPRIAAHEAEQ
ncbi:MAG TPA: GNAT family N-acetyltransferase [Mycobacteriales bacterium]|nr:GNAT family N-acetyltransferase [Mycobacteriales bacterium]